MLNLRGTMPCGGNGGAPGIPGNGRPFGGGGRPVRMSMMSFLYCA